MRIYTRQSQNSNKDQKPFIEPSGKTADNGNAFFAKSIQRKESEGGVKKDDEKKDQMQQQNKKLEEEKAQKKDSKDSKEEEQKVQKKEDKKEDEKQVQKKDDKNKKDEEKLKTKRISLKENSKIQKKDKDSSSRLASDDLEAKLASAKGKGFTLPDELCRELSSKMGSDFSAVRIHADGEAAAMAEELGALAFTYGNDIYFASGQFNPNTPTGKKLLVHELTHVMQQK